jgi:glutathione S-transferase
MSSPMLVVHHLQVGQGERIPWLLEELGIPYELKLYKRSPLLSPPELKKVNPLGASPVIQDFTDPENPITLAESSAICEYVIQKYASGRLALAPTHKNYADYLYWLHFTNGSFQPSLFRRASARAMVGESDPRYAGLDGRVKLALDLINKRLLKTDAWLAGVEFTAADVMMGWCFTTMRKFEPVDLTGYEGILAWLGRIGRRDAYRTAMSKGDPELDIDQGLSAQGPPLVEAFVKALAAKK